MVSRYDKEQSAKLVTEIVGQHQRNVKGHDKKQKNAVGSSNAHPSISSTSLNTMVDFNEPLSKNHARKMKSDPIGTHMARLLNEGAFERIMATSTQMQTNPGFFPLVSAANFSRIKKVLEAIVKMFFGSKAQSREAWWKSCQSLVKALLFCVVILSFGTGFILSFLLRIYLFIAISLFTLVFDVRYLYNNVCPKVIQRLIDRTEKYIKEIDRKFLFAHLLQGRNHFGEELKRNPLRDRRTPKILKRARNSGSSDPSSEASRESFRNIDWNMVNESLRSVNDGENELYSKTVDHLIAVNFAYVMMHEYGDQKEAQKKKNKKHKEVRKRSCDIALEDDAMNIRGNSRELKVDRDFNIVDALHVHGGIEMVSSNLPISFRPRMKRQKSSQRRANLLSFDGTDDANNQSFGPDQGDEFGSPRRPRICSETDIDFYASDENSHEGGDSDQKNKKWLDVGAKIGMRILKSEQVKEFIAHTTTVSADISEQLDDDLSFDDSHDMNKELDLPSPQIPKPFHAMWQTEDNQIFDDESEGYLSMDSEVSTTQRKRSIAISPVVSPNALRQTISLSSPRRVRGGPFHKSCSVPSSPRASFSNVQTKIDTCHESEGNISITSSEAIQWVPREFDANRHLPASMAVNHGVLTNKQPTTSRTFTPKEIRMRKTIMTRPRNHRRREPLLPGVKIVVPLFPLCSTSKSTRNSIEGRVHQLATVVSSERIVLNPTSSGLDCTDTLSITVLLDKAFLRNGKFAKMTLRILDSHRQFPKHSKFPIGDAIATSFGIGILVGWRLKDDCHILRALWQKRGQGSSHAYLNRNALHSVVEASIGFKVVTKYGRGRVIGYVNGGKHFCDGEYLVQVKMNGRNNNQVTSMSRSDVLTCTSAKFIPVVEQLKEAAKYQMQVDNYETEKLQLLLQGDTLLIGKSWRVFSQSFELFLSSFVKAAEEDENFDSEISNFLSQIISFLEDFELDGARKSQQISLEGDQGLDTATDEIDVSTTETPVEEITREVDETDTSMRTEASDIPGMWFLRDLFGDTKKNDGSNPENRMINNRENSVTRAFGEDSYKKVYAVLTILMRTVSIARAGCSDKPNLKMALAIVHESLLFIHNVIKVQQVNMTEASIAGWKETVDKLATLFGPMNARVKKVGNGIIQRLEDHGKVAKVRALSFAELLVVDDKLIESLEAGDGADCIARIEDAAVSAGIINEDARAQYHKLVTLLSSTLAPRANKESDAAARNGQKFTFLAKTIKVLATPARSALSLLTNDDILEVIERVLVRVFEKEQDASQTINIYSWTFRTFRHLRILNSIQIVGNLWAAILNAADEEFAWAVSRTPQNTQEYVKPISKLFSLGVARFHELHHSDSSVSADWLDFLKEDEAIRIIQDLDGALLLFVKNFCNDMKDMMYILPYYSSIDDDILNLIDEVDLERELKEIAEALADTEEFPNYMREKSAKAVSVFLDYLPKMSIPIEKREVGEGWVLTCRGRNGNDMTLSNVSIEKDNLLCRVLGGQNVLGLDEIDLVKKPSISSLMKDSVFSSDKNGNIEVSILDHVAELIRNAQSHGCWNVDSVFIMSATPLDGLPLSEVLHCAIELWENLQLDDDELLEIAIREISSQIQTQKAKDDVDCFDNESDKNWPEESRRIQNMHQEYVRKGVSIDVDICNALSIESNSTTAGRRFNPRKDPTVLYLAMNQLTCCLDDFTYRLEPAKSNSVFDPVFEGVGTLEIKNASIKIRVECRKERIDKLGEDVTIPVLQLQELEVGLEKVQFKFKETGLDWMLNKIVSNFFDKITQLVRENLREQICLSINNALETFNRYIEVNPDLMLKILGISIDDLEENVAWV